MYQNTDRELWREREGDYYADSIYVTEDGAIGIKCGGFTFVKTLREWHAAARIFHDYAKLQRLLFDLKEALEHSHR